MRGMKWALVMAPLALAACNQGKDGAYPDAVKANFVNACVKAGSPDKLCNCVIGKIEQQIPYARFAEMDTKARLGQPVDAEFTKVATDAVVACAKE